MAATLPAGGMAVQQGARVPFSARAAAPPTGCPASEPPGPGQLVEQAAEQP